MKGYKDRIYLFTGWGTDPIGNPHDAMLYFDLAQLSGSGPYKFEEMPMNKDEVYYSYFPVEGAGCAIVNNCAYFQGGLQVDAKGITNIAARIDLDASLINTEILSKGMVLPPSRMYHSMSIMAGIVYMYGGTDDGKTALDEMWTFDPAKVEWH
jgi:hypothetical protein